MKTASAALVSFLASYQPFIGADLYTITLFDGTVIRITSLDRSVTYTGSVSTNPDYGTQTYASLGQTGSGAPAIQRSTLSMAVGLQPSKLDLEIFDSGNTLVEGVPILLGIAQGKWVQAKVWIRRAFILPSDLPANWNTPVPTDLGGAGDGTLIWFSGFVGTITELGPLNCKMEVRDLLWYLNRPLPKNLFGPGCYHKLFDAGCGLHASDFTAGPNAVQAGSTATVVNTGLTQDSGIPAAPTSAPTMTSATTKYALPAVTYFAQVTYVTALGETLPSPEGSLACTPNKILTVDFPLSVSGASFYNVYVGTESGDEQKQNGDPIPIGTNWTMPTSGIYLGGVVPPANATNGYWSLGVITITYASGALSGQSVSAFVEASSPSGAVTLRVPLPQVPTTADSYTIIPGCDKQFTTCSGKFQPPAWVASKAYALSDVVKDSSGHSQVCITAGTSGPSGPSWNDSGGTTTDNTVIWADRGAVGNLVHFGGFPFTPTPEAGA